jgi:maleate isomerase
MAMGDVLGWRCKFGVMGPSTNTVVQPDFDMMRPAGVTNHYSRIFTPNADAISNESFRAGAEVIAGNTLDAVRSVMTCRPDHLIMGMSAVTFFDGARGADRFVKEVEGVSGLKITAGSHACTAALNAYGGVKRIAVLSPYWPAMNTEVARYFTDMGFLVVRDIALRCKSWVGIAEVTPKECVEAIRQIDGDDVDAIVQVGTNLSMVKLAVMAEMWLGKPIIPINLATYWHALRTRGIMDKVEGCGTLLERY